MNRDLSRRIRTVNGITSHKTVVRNDIRLAARIIQNLDSRFGLWQNKDEKEQPKSELEVSFRKSCEAVGLITNINFVAWSMFLKTDNTGINNNIVVDTAFSRFLQ